MRLYCWTSNPSSSRSYPRFLCIVPCINTITFLATDLIHRGEPIPENIPNNLDLILAADCVYFEPAFPLLVDTLCALVRRNIVNDPEPSLQPKPNHPQILFCYKKRRKVRRSVPRLSSFLLPPPPNFIHSNWYSVIPLTITSFAQSGFSNLVEACFNAVPSVQIHVCLSANAPCEPRLFTLYLWFSFLSCSTYFDCHDTSSLAMRFDATC